MCVCVEDGGVVVVRQVFICMHARDEKEKWGKNRLLTLFDEEDELFGR